MALATGIIAIWSGALVDIPAGWVLCNGANGTPDLRSSFIQGAAVGANPGTTGGSNTHGHDAHPIQTHSGFAVTDHAALAHSGGLPDTHGFTSFKNVASVVGYSYNHTLTSNSATHAPVTHTVSAQASDHAAQAHVDANNEPAYYVCAFIMKT